MNNINKIVRLSILTTIALTIFMIELHIPPLVPIPGVKLGLANIITLIVLYLYGIREASTVLIIRILLGSMFSGQVVSLLYSLSGGLMCLLVMILLMKIVGKEGVWFVSVGGAIAHNIGQIIIAMILFQTTSVLYYLPVLILSGVITGVFTGMLSKYMITNKVINRLISNSLYLFQTTSVLYYLPVLILSGVITGVFTGMLSKYMITNKVINRLISNSL